MCGIFGYIGKKTKVTQMIFEGLKMLEYRGYDSWGIAVKIKNYGEKEGAGFLVEKHTGLIANSKIKPEFLKIDSELGIGHTRWATHGGVTDINAHPHLDCSGKIAVVHNGIVENYQEIRESLIKKGHKFKSETDTEIIAHLIEEYLKKEGFAHSVRNAFNDLKGLNAIVVSYSLSVEIIACKTGSPLVIGKSKDGYFVASDSVGIIKHTNEILFLEDYQMAILGKDIKLINLQNGDNLRPVFQKLDWKFVSVEKGEFKHFLLKEIYEQPQVIENIATSYQNQIFEFSKLIESALETFMVGCGTASYAALTGVYLFSKIAKHHINFSIGSEFAYIEDYLTSKSLVIPISQSGETIDVVGPVEKSRKRGVKIAALVNTLGSTLYRQSDYKILLGAGVEKAVVATKSFIAMYSILLLTAFTLVKKENLGKKLLLDSVKNLKDIFSLKYINKIKDLAKVLKNKEHIYILGRGLSYAAALEGALKLKETACVHAEGFAGGELKHGVITLIEKGTPCIIVAPNDETYDDIISNAQEVKARGGLIIGIGSRANSVFDIFLPTDDIEEATFIPQIVIFQLLAYYLALARGIKDPDKPRNLAKSVTVK